MYRPASRTACVKAFTLTVRVRKSSALTAYLHWRLAYINGQCNRHYTSGWTMWTTCDTHFQWRFFMWTTTNTSAINTPSSPDQHYSAEPPSIGGELGGPKIAKYKGGGFALHFFGGGGLRRLINASHSSFCISASHFELKLDLARERVFYACVLRER